jgi:DNA polymerase III epsilon subunit-like protein
MTMAVQTSLFASALQNETPANAHQSAKASTALFNTPLSEAIFTVIDLETTGLNPKRNAITEMTAIQYQNEQQIGIYSTLVQPKEPISPEIESLTGISNAMVANAPPLVMALNELLTFIGPNPIIVGHNVTFDLGFLKEKCNEVGFGSLEARFGKQQALCTKVLAQKAMPGLPSYQGLVVATQCGYHNANPHRAEADVRMSAAILFALTKRLQAEGHALTTVGELLAYQGLLG